MANVKSHTRKTRKGQVSVRAHQRNSFSPWVKIEATDEADALALKERIEMVLETLDGGDYSGRVVELSKEV